MRSPKLRLKKKSTGLNLGTPTFGGWEIRKDSDGDRRVAVGVRG